MQSSWITDFSSLLTPISSFRSQIRDVFITHGTDSSFDLNHSYPMHSESVSKTPRSTAMLESNRVSDGGGDPSHTIE